VSLHIGRATLNTPLEVRPTIPRRAQSYVDAMGRGIPFVDEIHQELYRTRGRDTPANLTTLEVEGGRVGSVYVYDDATTIPSGWYEVMEALDYTEPGGAPQLRKWSMGLQAQTYPFVTRQAENENVAGSVVADNTADGGQKVVYTPTTSDVKVLDPRNKAGAERVNLPAGTYSITARVQSTTTFDQLYRCKVTDGTGAVLTTGAQVAATAAGAWQIVNLGTFTIADANAGANWFEIWVQGIAGHLNDVWLDRIRLVRQ